MKTKKGSRIVNVLKRIINVRSWVDYDRTKAAFDFVARGLKKLFIPQKQTKADNFNQVAKQMNINEEALLARQKSLKRYSIFMMLIGLVIFFYALVHLYYGNWRAVMVSLVVMLIALVLAFRYHFWYFQIKQRKLGCSIHEWFRKGLLGEKE